MIHPLEYDRRFREKNKIRKENGEVIKTRDSDVETVSILNFYKKYLLLRNYKIGSYKYERNLQRKLNEVSKKILFYRSKSLKPSKTLTYSEYKNVVEMLFKNAQDEIIEGKSLHLGKKLGYIAALTTERVIRGGDGLNKGKINFGETRKLQKLLIEKEKEGVDITNKKYIVKFTDRWFVEIKWFKYVNVKTKSNYFFRFKFYPTNSNTTNTKVKGFKGKFSDSNLQNPNLKFNYMFRRRRQSKEERETLAKLEENKNIKYGDYL